MARLNDQLDSDDELPELSSILGCRTEAIVGTSKQVREIPCPVMGLSTLAINNCLTQRHAANPSTVIGLSSNKPQSRMQRPLGSVKQAHINSLLPPMSDVLISKSENEDYQSPSAFDRMKFRSSPRKLADSIADRIAQASANTNKAVNHDRCSSSDLSVSTVPDSASAGESSASASPKKKEKKQKKSRSSEKTYTANPQKPSFQVSGQPKQNTRQPSEATVLILPEEKNRGRICQESSASNEPFRSEPIFAHARSDDHLK